MNYSFIVSTIQFEQFLSTLLLLHSYTFYLQDYYFISTSGPSDLHSRAGGFCRSHNMKVVFKVVGAATTSTTGRVGTSQPPQDEVFRINSEVKPLVTSQPTSGGKQRKREKKRKRRLKTGSQDLSSDLPLGQSDLHQSLAKTSFSLSSSEWARTARPCLLLLLPLLRLLVLY